MPSSYRSRFTVKSPLRNFQPCSVRPCLFNVWTPYWAEKLPCVKEGFAIKVANHNLKASKRSESKEVGGIQIPYHLSSVYECLRPWLERLWRPSDYQVIVLASGKLFPTSLNVFMTAGSNSLSLNFNAYIILGFVSIDYFSAGYSLLLSLPFMSNNFQS